MKKQIKNSSLVQSKRKRKPGADMEKNNQGLFLSTMVSGKPKKSKTKKVPAKRNELKSTKIGRKIKKKRLMKPAKAQVHEIESHVKGQTYREIHNIGVRQASRQVDYCPSITLCRITRKPAPKRNQISAPQIVPLTIRNLRKHNLAIQNESFEGFPNSRRYTEHGDGYLLSWVDQQVECHSKRVYANLSCENNISEIVCASSARASEIVHDSSSLRQKEEPPPTRQQPQPTTRKRQLKSKRRMTPVPAKKRKR